MEIFVIAIKYLFIGIGSAVTINWFISILFTKKMPPPPAPKVVKLSPQAYLERQTYIRALEGDKHARDWITKRLYDQGKDQPRKQQPTQRQQKRKQEQKKTNIALRQEGISALKSLGHSKKEATSIIDSLISSKNYSNTEELIKDAFRRN